MGGDSWMSRKRGERNVRVFGCLSAWIMDGWLDEKFSEVD